MRPTFEEVFGTDIDPERSTSRRSRRSAARRTTKARRARDGPRSAASTCSSWSRRSASSRTSRRSDAGLRDLAFETLWAYNTWATDHLAGHTDRLIPVTLVDLADVDWAIAEIRRMRSGAAVVQVRASRPGQVARAPRLRAVLGDRRGPRHVDHVPRRRWADITGSGLINDGDSVLDFIAAYAGLSEPQMPEWALAR